MEILATQHDPHDETLTPAAVTYLGKFAEN
jgi:hypothetical protein